MTFEIKDLAGLSKPLERLIEVTSAGIGRVTKAHFVKKDADAKAYEIRSIAQAMADSRRLIATAGYDDGKVNMAGAPGQTPSLGVDESQLTARTLERQAFTELVQQQNTEAIVSRAAEELSGDKYVPEEKPEPEWTSRFFRIAEDIPTEELQYLWGRILAGEIRKPGSFSLRTLETVRNLSKKEAETFVKLAPYLIRSGEDYFYLREPEYVVGQQGKLIYTEMMALREAGLINSEPFLGYTLGAARAGTTQWYLNGSIGLRFEFASGRDAVTLQVGVLTAAGIQLLKLVTPLPDIEYLNLFAQQLRAEGVSVYSANVQMVDEQQFVFSNEALLTLPK
jgi:hypothetical protein